MPRLLFEKRGQAIYISHLDLMRLMQRAFQRSGLRLTHTQGFNPRPTVSIALPLSVGVESICELLDFDLDGQQFSGSEICKRLNDSLIPGIRVLDCYDAHTKTKDIAFLACRICLEYDRPISEDVIAAVQELFARDEIIMEKKSKNGISQQNIIEMIRSIQIIQEGDSDIVLNAVICCQNPSLNPSLLHAAVSQYLPEFAPSFAHCCRMELYDVRNNIFR